MIQKLLTFMWFITTCCHFGSSWEEPHFGFQEGVRRRSPDHAIVLFALAKARPPRFRPRGSASFADASGASSKDGVRRKTCSSQSTRACTSGD